MKIGIDLGGSHIAIGIVDNNGQIIEKKEVRILEREKKNITKFIENYIVENVSEYIKKYDIKTIGIAVPGTLDQKSIIKSVNLEIENYNIVEELNKKIKLPIKIKNDAKCAALAENKYGALKNYNRTLFLTLGTGIGGAVVINNELLDTGDLPGMEVGHMVINKEGLLCKCGNKGCFEKYASMKALKNNLREQLNLDEKTKGQELFEMIRNNEKSSNNYEIIENVIIDFIENLSIGIGNLVNLFEPEAIVIGGSFVYFEEVLLERLKNNLITGNYFFNRKNNFTIKTAILGNEAGIIGATLI